MIGTLVRMSRALKNGMRANGSGLHVREFGGCAGVVIGPVDYGTSRGPEVDVRWLPTGLRYAYHPDQLLRSGKKLRGWRRKAQAQSLAHAALAWQFAERKGLDV